MSAEKNPTVSVSLPKAVIKGEMPKQIYLTFEKDPHKISLLNTFKGYERTATVRVLAEFWFPKIIAEVMKAMEEGAESITFELEADED